MTGMALASRFVSRFCTGDIGPLGTLLADDYYLVGPRRRWSRQAYLATLASDSSAAGSARVISPVTDRDEVSLLYEYRQGTGSTVVSQTSRIRDGLGRKLARCLRAR